MTTGPERFIRASVEAAWGCRLAYARLMTPVHPPAIDQFEPMGSPGDPWVYDWYSHVLFASQLFEAARALAGVVQNADLERALSDFREHWQRLSGLRNVLLHPTSTNVNLEHLWPFFDRLTYQAPGHDPEWVFTRDDLQQPVERLYAAIDMLR